MVALNGCSLFSFQEEEPSEYNSLKLFFKKYKVQEIKFDYLISTTTYNR